MLTRAVCREVLWSIYRLSKERLNQQEIYSSACIKSLALNLRQTCIGTKEGGDSALERRGSKFWNQPMFAIVYYLVNLCDTEDV